MAIIETNLGEDAGAAPAPRDLPEPQHDVPTLADWETAAAREYWFDYHGRKEGAAASTFSPAYGHGVTGILGGGGRAFATYFSGDPAWIYGIQWLPASPFMNYLGQDRDFAKAQLQSMWDERAKRPGESNDLDAMGALGTVILGFAAEADPDWAAARRAWARP